jgi:hypothetical protein
MRRICGTLLSLAALAGAAAVSYGGGRDASPAEAILGRLVETERWREANLQCYQVTRLCLLTGDRFQQAEMNQRLLYTYPGRKQIDIISTSGSSFLQKRVFSRVIQAELEASGDEMRNRVKITPCNYEFRYAGPAAAGGRACHTFDIKPRSRNKFLIEGRIWVDAEDAAIIRVEGRPVGAQSFWLRNPRVVLQYEKVGPFWLISSSEHQGEVRLFGSARLIMKYENYVINRQLVAEKGR